MTTPSPTRCGRCGLPVLGGVHVARIGGEWAPRKPPKTCREVGTR